MVPLHDDNPTSRPPVVTVGLIVACVLVFLWQFSLGERAQQRVVYGLGLIPAVLLGEGRLPPEVSLLPPEMTVVTSMFLHGSWLHLIGNMLYLWIFGNNVEDAAGHVRFVIFYLLCGVAAAAAQILLNPSSTLPMVGASGAISGVLGAYLLLYPHARVLVGIPLGFYLHLMYLPALMVLGFWIVLQLVSSLLADPEQGGVAFFAHVGGFMAGMALIPFFKGRRVRLLNPPRRVFR
jgi:membrane associated rhomboid family serine protease